MGGRCNLGVADGNDAFTMRQGAACASLASRLAAQAEPDEAIGYARKSCQLEDASGCQRYLVLVRARTARGTDVDRGACHTATLAPGESRCAGAMRDARCAGARTRLTPEAGTAGPARR